ncbi:glyco_rpt_poly: oligosaccharide repeat unit polymerase (plasmid) [Pseudosulfitobacter pseudonitzschiae]|uniref:Glyco_rpt_poly: oligosaccharide repeat unit polymerase n=1 Tax=Pseudosulfitobacter pseudonitzschiae TaxID=1402135 RepID=A0A221K6K9_9RHOB|nr:MULTISPECIES: oligosaccharide repeat unit polymerase [Roseobacteraceae]ASM74629.1 glyco_rpt_poly: oligosaccharide repeat unit polymerase [Pseudosulfitobacter pseudonitzschiae]
MIYRPERVLIAGFWLFAIIFFIAPLEVKVDLHAGAFVFIGLSCLGFVLGCRFADRLALRRRGRIVSRGHIARRELTLYNIMLTIGVLGNGLRLLDRFVFRSVGSLSGLEAREALIDTGTSTVSLIAGVLYPFGYLPIFIYLGAHYIPRSRVRLLLALGLFLIPALDALVFFSRSFMLVSLAMIYFGLSVMVFRGQVLSAKLLVPAIVGVIGVASLSALVFIWRLDEMQFDIVDSIFQSGYGYTISPNAAAESILADSGPVSSLLASFLPLAQYFTHPIFEFQILWEGAADQTYSYGALLFAPYVKALSMFGVATVPDLFDLFPRVGIFTSFFGPLWVDFGWFSPLVMLVFGVLARLLGRQAQRGDIGAYPLYVYFCVILFFAPVVNFAISAQGMYTINAFIIFYILSRHLRSYAVATSSK